MNTLTVKISLDLERQIINFSQRENLTKSELVRRAVAAYVTRQHGQKKFVSALELAGELVGCFKGGPSDLASNPKYMEDYGK